MIFELFENSESLRFSWLSDKKVLLLIDIELLISLNIIIYFSKLMKHIYYFKDILIDLIFTNLIFLLYAFFII